MKLQDNIDYSMLAWVKPELDETLRQARLALEAYAEDPTDQTHMLACAAGLHQVQGSLRMVELYGGAMVVEEMEQLVQGLIAGTIRQRDDGYAVLMRGMVQLPDYLERLQSGHKDIPIVLLPLLNDLRACRGEKLLTESVLFAPDLGAPLPASAAGAVSPLPSAQVHAGALQLRVAFQATLLKWIRDEDALEPTERLVAVLDRLLSLSSDEAARRLWWIAAGVAEAVHDRGLKSSVALKLLFGRIDRQLRGFASAVQRQATIDPPRELLQNLLYYVAHTTSDGERVRAVRDTYRLDTLLPSEKELQHARGSMTGHSRNLLDTVSIAIKDDLLRVKDALDIFLRAHQPHPGDLLPQVELLDRVADTLGMLGLGAPRRVIGEQRQIIEEIATGQRAADEGVLLDVAGALLYVDGSLDDHVERLGASPEGSDDGELEMPQVEVRKLLGAVMQEARTNLHEAKQSIIAFIESPWDHDRVEPFPRLLEEIVGALRMLGLEAAATLMTGVVRFVEVELLEHRRVPTTEQMDHLADALASIEYYLEATREQRGGRERILDVTRHSLEVLGYWPVPEHRGTATPNEEEASSAIEASIAAFNAADPEAGTESQDTTMLADAPAHEVAVTQAEAGHTFSPDPAWSEYQLDAVVNITDDGDMDASRAAQDAWPQQSDADATGPVGETSHADAGDWVEVEEEFEEEILDPHLVDAGFQSVGSDDFDDIRDVFMEEVDDEIANLRSQLPIWRLDPEDMDKLVPLRRSFHTLKGSGRLVGALTLGEFSWKVESMLNRVLDRTIKPSLAVQTVLERAIDALPALLAALQGGQTTNVDLSGIMDTADRLAAGEMAMLPDATARRTRTIKRLVRRRLPAASRTQEVPASSASPPAVPTARTLRDTDPVLFDILNSEVANHLASIDQYLGECTGAAAPVAVSQTLLRAVHTLNGAIAMVDMSAIGQVLAPLEGYVRRLCALRQGADSAGLAALGQASALVREVMLRQQSGVDAMPDTAQLAARVIALRDVLPEPESPIFVYSDMPGADDAEIEDDDRVQADPEPVADTADGDLPVSTEDADGAEALAGFDDEDLTAALVQVFSTEDADVTAAAQATAVTTDTFDEVHAALASEGNFFDDAKLDFGLGIASTDDELAAIVDPSHGLSSDLAVGDDVLWAPTDLANAEAHAATVEIGVTPPELPEAPAPTTDAESIVDSDMSGLDEATESNEAFGSDAGMAPDHEVSLPEFAATLEVATDDIESALDVTMPHRTDATLPASVQPADAMDELADTEVGEEFVAGQDEAEPASTAVEIAIEADAAAEPESEPAPRRDATAHTAPIAEDIQPGDEKLDIPDLDDDLLEIFVQEGVDILDHSDASMARLREAPQELDPVVSLQRDLHTLKGGARMAGLAPIGDLSHAMESLLDAVVDGRHGMDRIAVESLEHGFDLLHALVQRVARYKAVAMPVNAIARFEALVAGRSPEIASTDAPSVNAHAPAAPTRAPVDLSALDLEEAPRAPQEMIRVRSELLDSLVNYAGEVSIYRSRLEQQVSSFRFNLIEFEQTVTRLREQLRMLEMETEAQIIARYQREQHDTGETSFDPLELDRFSQLQQYSRALGESVSDLVSIQGFLDDITRQSETLLLQQSRVSSDLQEGLMRTRMVPFDSLVPSLRRTVRQAAQELGKRAQIRVEGAQGEMDRNLLERMKAPFEHILRNAIAHGIETPEQREANGKPVDGTVNIAVSREATEVVLRISDDGRGLDRAAIRAKAVERGLMDPDAELSDRDIFGFIVESGFSTADRVTQLAGRGVGMDVVHNEIKQLGGSLQIDSERGKATTFTLRLPFTLAVTQAILVKLGDAVHAIPMASVQGVVRIANDDYQARLATGSPIYSYAGEDYLIHELSQLLGVPPGRVHDETQLPLVMLRSGDQRAAVRIDAVVGSREIVVKSVGPQISSVPGIFGATIMGDGSVVMILDLAPLVRRAAAWRDRAKAEGAELAPMRPAPVAVEERPRQPLIMVVDDSITMRKVTTRVLERAEMEVVTAKDGMDAVEKLQDVVPDLMLLDIEMPRMDGYELATYMKNDPRLKRVPIIMVTSRTGEKHRQRALEIGVERYLGKPYQEADLLRQVQETLRTERA